MPKISRHFMKCLKFGAHFYTNCLKLWISHMKKILSVNFTGISWKCLKYETFYVIRGLYDFRIIWITRSSQRAQTSLAEADHYSHIAHCKNVEPWLWKTTHPLKKKKKGSGSLPAPRSGYTTTIKVFFRSFTHLTIPRSPPKFNQFFLVLLRTRP